MERRVFTFEEARQLLPQVRERTRHAVDEMGEIEIASDDGDDDALRRDEPLEAVDRLLDEGALAPEAEELLRARRARPRPEARAAPTGEHDGVKLSRVKLPLHALDPILAVP